MVAWDENYQSLHIRSEHFSHFSKCAITFTPRLNKARQTFSVAKHCQDPVEVALVSPIEILLLKGFKMPLNAVVSLYRHSNWFSISQIIFEQYYNCGLVLSTVMLEIFYGFWLECLEIHVVLLWLNLGSNIYQYHGYLLCRIAFWDIKSSDLKVFTFHTSLKE